MSWSGGAEVLRASSSAKASPSVLLSASNFWKMPSIPCKWGGTTSAAPCFKYALLRTQNRGSKLSGGTKNTWHTCATVIASGTSSAHAKIVDKEFYFKKGGRGSRDGQHT